MWKYQNEQTKEKFKVLRNIALNNSQNESERKILLRSLTEQCNQSNDDISWDVPPFCNDACKYYYWIGQFSVGKIIEIGHLVQYLRKNDEPQ